MRLIKDYKKVAIIYILLTLINVIWIVSYDRNDNVKQVSNDKKIALK